MKKQRRQYGNGKRRSSISFEQLEARHLLAASPFGTNPLQPLDVNRDGNVSAVDALQIINAITESASRSVDPANNIGSFIDVSGDGLATAFDALQVINALSADTPLIAATLPNDSSPSARSDLAFDLLTNNYAIDLNVSLGELGSERVRMRVGDTANLVDITDRFTDGLARLTTDDIDTFVGGPLSDGEHNIFVQIGDNGNAINFPLTVDRIAPRLNLQSIREEMRVSPEIRMVGEQRDENPAGMVQVTVGSQQTVTPINRDGTLDVPLADLIAPGSNTIQVRSTDAAGNVTELSRQVTRSEDFETGANDAEGWVSQNDEVIVLGGRDSFVLQADHSVFRDRSVPQRLEFDLDVRDSATGRTSLLAYLVDPNATNRSALPSVPDGDPVFRLHSDSAADYPPGLVQFDGSRVSIDLSEVSISRPLLRIQRISDRVDDASLIQISDIDVREFESSPLRSMSSRLPTSAIGPEVELTLFEEKDRLTADLRNRQFASDDGTFVVDLSLRAIQSTPRSSVVVQFPNLPDGVALSNPSGTDGDGVPYVNLSNAIPTSGFAVGQSSDVVQLRLSNPDRLQFELAARVLIGAENRPPELQPVEAEQTVRPGEVLRIDFAASDPEGDRLSYRLLPRDSAVLPSGSIDAAGLLSISPRPEEIGSYEFDVIVSDGELEVRQPMMVNVVADSITTTRVSGQILDVDGSAIAGMQIDLGQTSVLTDATGRFTIDMGDGPLLTDVLKVRGELYSGSDVYPYIAERLFLVLGRDAIPGVNNVIARPIYLPKIDVAGGQTIDPMVDTVVTAAAIPGVSVEIDAGTLVTQQGLPFEGVLSITEVPVNLTPASLPPNFQPDLVVTIQPGDMRFTTPAPLTLPNRAGLPAGEIVDLWSINPATGEFDDVGDMRVSFDGQTLETISGGIRNSSWHGGFAPPAPLARLLDTLVSNKKEGCPVGCEAKAESNSQVELHSGALREQHSLVSYQSLGETRGLTLHYDSQRADPRPIVTFGYDNVRAVPSQRLVGSLTVSRGGFQAQIDGASNGTEVVPGQHYFSTPEAGSLFASIQGDMTALPTGTYQYQLRQGLMQLTDDRVVGTTEVQRGEIIHVNARDSEFGAGWQLSGLHRLVENPDGSVLLVEPTGNTRQFLPQVAEGEFITPPGDFSTLVRLADGTFRRTMKDSSFFLFDTSGRLTSFQDRNGNQTIHVYEDDRLVRITDPVGLETKFAYNDDGYVSSITDPSGRETNFEYDNFGNLLRITDPDDTSRTFAYDNSHRLIQEIDKRGQVEQTLYGFHGRVERSIRKDGSEMLFQPLQTRLLHPPSETLDPVDPAPAQILEDANATVVDGNGNIRETELDQFGQTVTTIDTEGSSSFVQRNVSNQVVLSRNTRGFTDQFQYDSQGNLISVDRPSTASGPMVPLRLTSGQTATGLAGDFELQQSKTNNYFDFDQFVISANTGDRLVVSYGLASFSEFSDVAIIAPSGQIVPVEVLHDLGGLAGLYSSGATVQTDILTESGDYSLVIQHPLTRPSFVNQYYLTPAVITPNVMEFAHEIVNGSTFSGSVANRGEIQAFIFDAQAGQDLRIWRDFLNSTVALLYGPDMEFIQNDQSNSGTNQFSSQAHVFNDLPTDGQYTLITQVDGPFCWQQCTQPPFEPIPFELGVYLFDDIIESDQGLIASGETITATLQPGESEAYHFNVTEDSFVHLATNEVDANLSTSRFLVRPDGFVQTLRFDNIASGNRLSSPGVYTLVLTTSGANPDATIEFDISLVSIDPSIHTFSDNLEPGEFIDSTLERSDFDVYSTDVRAGDKYVLSIVGDANATAFDLRVYEPSREFPTQVTAFPSRTTLVKDILEDGTLTVVVQGVEGGSLQDYSLLVTTGDEDNQTVTDRHNDLLNNEATPRRTVSDSKRSVDYRSTPIFDAAPVQLVEVRDTGLSSSRSFSVSPEVGPEIEVFEFPIDVASGGTILTSYAVSFEFETTLLAPDGTELVGSTEVRSNQGIRAVFEDLPQTGTYKLRFVVDGTRPIGFAGFFEVIVAAFDAAFTDSFGQPIKMTYDDTFGQLTSMTDELGRQTHSTLDPATGNTEVIREVVGLVDDATNGETDDLVTFISYTDNGLIDEMTDPLGRMTDYEYDTIGLLTSVTFAAGSAVEATRRFEYDDRGNQTVVIDENGNRTQFEYDDLDRLTRIIEADPDGDGPLVSPETSFAYDAAGNLIETTDAAGSVTQVDFDPLDRPSLIRDEVGNETTTQYDRFGNVASVTDANGNVTRFTYDGRNRRTSTTDPDGGVTRFEYDADNNLTALIDPVGNRTEFAYDGRDRLVRETDPLGAVTSYTYDPVDNLVRKTDRNGRSTEFVYDELDRLVGEQWYVGVQASAASSSGDPDPNRLKPTLQHSIDYEFDKLGNLLSIEDSFSRYDYAYDERNRVTDVDARLTANVGVQALAAIEAGDPDRLKPTLQHSLTYAYDDVGNVVGVTESSGATTLTQYDALNRPISMQQSGGGATEKAVDMAFNQIGQYESLTRYSDLGRNSLVARTDYTYDAINRLTDLDHTGATDAVLAFYDFDYDSASRITAITDVTGRTNYRYDDRDQLTGAVRSASDVRGDENYAYDANGNRLDSHLHGENYQTGEANRLISDGTYSYEYDDEGNMVLRTEDATGDYRTFEFDHRNRLFRVTDFSSGDVILQEVTYTYDALDRRIARTVDSNGDEAGGESTEMYVYDREDVLLDFVDADGSLATASPELAIRYFHGPGIDQVLAREIIATGQNHWFLTDHLGTTRELVGDDGGLLNRLTYDSFGNLVAETNAGVSTRYQFTGREFDEAIGLHYYRARFYDAGIGRFVSEDPIGFAAGDTQLSGYVFNSPQMYTDPSGEIVPFVGGAIIGIGAVIGGVSEVITGGGFDSAIENFIIGAGKGAATTAAGLALIPVAGGAVATAAGVILTSAVGAGLNQLVETVDDDACNDDFSLASFAFDTGLGIATAGFARSIPTPKRFIEKPGTFKASLSSPLQRGGRFQPNAVKLLGQNTFGSGAASLAVSTGNRTAQEVRNYTRR